MNSVRQRGKRGIVGLACPDDFDGPSQTGEFAAVLPVTYDRALKFRNPVTVIRFRQMRVAAFWIGVLMPETSLNLHDRAVLRKHDVGTAGKGVAVKRVAKSL